MYSRATTSAIADLVALPLPEDFFVDAIPVKCENLNVRNDMQSGTTTRYLFRNLQKMDTD